MTPVDIYLQNGKGAGTHLKVPAAYMQWEEDRSGGPNLAIAVITIYPEMTPYGSLSSQERAKYAQGISGNDPLCFDPLITIQSAVPESIQLRFADYTNPARVISVAEESNFSHYIVNRFGSVREYFVPRGVEISEPSAGRRGPFFECLPNPSNVPPEESPIRCIGKVQLNDRLLFDYSIPRRHLIDWRTVNEHVTTLVESFIVDCFEGEILKNGMTPATSLACLP